MNKLDNFKATIHDTHHNIFCITESWLKPNLDDTFLSIKNFNIYRQDRKTVNVNGYVERGGGIILYSRNDVDIRPVQSNFI